MNASQKILATVLFVFISCNERLDNANPYLNLPTFSISINMSLPLYNDLRLAGNSIYISSGGIRGILILNTGGQYLAWEAACPNHLIKICSTMSLKGSVSCQCPCDGYAYSLFNGLLTSPETVKNPQTLIRYFASESNGIITISN